MSAKPPQMSPGRDRESSGAAWSDDERIKLLQTYDPNTTWETYHKRNLFPGRTKIALYAEWRKLNQPNNRKGLLLKQQMKESYAISSNVAILEPAKRPLTPVAMGSEMLRPEKQSRLEDELDEESDDNGDIEPNGETKPLHIQQALHRRTQELRNSPFMRQTPNKRVPAREHLQPILSPTMPKATLTHPLPSRPSLDQPSIVGIDSPFSNRTSQSTGVESNTTAAANTTSKSPQLSWTSPATQVTMSPQPSTTEALQERLIDNGKDTMAASIGFQNTPPVSRTNSPGGTAIAEPRTANPTIGSEYWARNGNTAPLANHSKSIPRTPYTFAEVLPSANTHASEGSIQTQTEALNSPVSDPLASQHKPKTAPTLAPLLPRPTISTEPRSIDSHHTRAQNIKPRTVTHNSPKEHSSVPSPGALASAEGTARPSERPKQERHGPHPPHPLGPFASSLTKEDCLAGALQLLARFAQLETEDQQRTADLRACVNAQQKQLEIIESSGAEQLEALRHQVANMRKDREKERHEIEKEREDVKDRLVRAEEFMTRFSSFFNIMQQHKSDQGAPRQGCEGQQPMPK